MSKEKSSGAFVWGFLAGAIAATAYTLLKTPRSGQETIAQIKGQGARLKTRAEEMAGDLLHHADDTAAGWQQTAETGWQQATGTGPQYWQADLEGAARQANAAAEDIVEQVQEQADETADAVQATAAQAVDAMQDQAADAVEKAEDILKS